MQNSGCVYLVGAGCGEADLITVRGLELLKNCNALVYDDLIAAELLEVVPKEAELIYMGKRSGQHSAPQEAICGELIRLAKEGKTVVRLKGGDPFVFGRGGEEILALQKENIPYEEVPGISSSIAIPAAAGIPVTHRKLSRSFHVITGHTADTEDGLPKDIPQYAKLSGTLVFLMGLRQLPRIAARLIEGGKAADTPAAVISGVDRAHPKTVRGTLQTIADNVRDAGLVSPAVIVVGEVTELDFTGTIKKPLDGVVCALTGTDSMAQKLKTGLESLGAKTFTAERSVVKELPFELDIQKLTDGKTHWIVFTSGNGVRIFFDRIRKQNLDVRALHACRFAVIGAATGKKLADYGIIADLCPAVYTSKGLAEAMIDRIKAEEDVLVYRSIKGTDVLPTMLTAAGIEVSDIPIYDLEAEGDASDQLMDKVKASDFLIFSSAGGVELVHKLYGGIPEGPTCVSIGEVTSDGLRRYGIERFEEAEEISAEGIIAKICEIQGR